MENMWIDVNDRLPDITKTLEITSVSNSVLVYDKYAGITVCWLKRFDTDSIDTLYPERIKGFTMFENTQYHFENVTHWTPLPKPPKK